MEQGTALIIRGSKAGADLILSTSAENWFFRTLREWIGRSFWVRGIPGGARLAREASEANEDYLAYLLRLSELELATRASNALAHRIKLAGFPVIKELPDFDFSLAPTVSKPRVLELSKGDWIDRHETACFLGNSGTGKTHLAVAIGLCACRGGKRVKFGTTPCRRGHLRRHGRRGGRWNGWRCGGGRWRGVDRSPHDSAAKRSNLADLFDSGQKRGHTACVSCLRMP